MVHSLSTLIVTGDCSYSDGEIRRILTGMSIGICKSIKGNSRLRGGNI